MRTDVTIAVAESPLAPIPPAAYDPAKGWSRGPLGEFLAPANASGKRGRQLPTYSKGHPINFAQFCYCDRCRRLVDQVETKHPMGIDRGPWTIVVRCHQSTETLKLSEEAVAAYIAGAFVPAPTLFFIRPRPLSPDEAAALDSEMLDNTYSRR